MQLGAFSTRFGAVARIAMMPRRWLATPPVGGSSGLRGPL
jgi:hypothetical protein